MNESLTFLFAEDRTRIDSLAATIEITYVGAGRMVPAPADSVTRPSHESQSGSTPSRITGWIGINPATCNQFRIRVPNDTRRRIAGTAAQKGFGRAAPGRDGTAITIHPPDGALVLTEQYCPPQSGPYFSGCLDSRMRSGTLTYPESTVTNFSADGQMSSCTGTLVGPRHVLTAGHCLYQGNNTWHDFTVIPGRDAAYWPFGSTQMSDTQGLNQGFRWYWIPEAIFDGPVPDWYSGLDIGIIVIPPAFENDFDCENNPLPYSATRITPEYIDWFLYFRSWKP